MQQFQKKNIRVWTYHHCIIFYFNLTLFNKALRIMPHRDDKNTVFFHLCITPQAQNLEVQTEHILVYSKLLL